MLWLAIFLPRLASEALPGRYETGTSPWAVCDRLTVLQVNEAAQALGVRAGIKRATALAIAPELHLIQRDQAREHEALRQLACWALQFTPSVSLQTGLARFSDELRNPAHACPARLGLLLEVAPSLRLFGGRTALLQRLRSGLLELGFSAQIASAPTATGAWLLACHRDGACADSKVDLQDCLAPLPAALLDPARAQLPILETIGARTLGDLRSLPRAGLARRFGPALLAGLDHAFGQEPEPRQWFEAPASFEARLELFAEVETTEALLFAARRMIIQLTGWLGARQSGTRDFELHLEHGVLPATLVQVRLADPSRDSARMLGVLREALNRTPLGAPVHTLRLRCGACVSLAPDTANLFPMPSASREAVSRLIERLQARLGREQVQQLRIAADHRPESAWRQETVESFPARASRNTINSAQGLPRPLWLQARPTPLTERNGRPWLESPLSLLAGPERIESGWWDGALVQRDYFIAGNQTGQMFWIFRQRLPDTTGSQGWFVHGRFG